MARTVNKQTLEERFRGQLTAELNQLEHQIEVALANVPEAPDELSEEIRAAIAAGARISHYEGKRWFELILAQPISVPTGEPKTLKVSSTSSLGPLIQEWAKVVSSPCSLGPLTQEWAKIVRQEIPALARTLSTEVEMLARILVPEEKRADILACHTVTERWAWPVFNFLGDTPRDMRTGPGWRALWNLREVVLNLAAMKRQADGPPSLGPETNLAKAEWEYHPSNVPPGVALSAAVEWARGKLKDRLGMLSKEIFQRRPGPLPDEHWRNESITFAEDDGTVVTLTAYHLGLLFLAWEEVGKEPQTKIPSSLVIPGRFFGARIGEEGSEARREPSGRIIISCIRRTHDVMQLEMFLPKTLEIQDTEDLAHHLDSRLGNRAFRVLAGCFCAATEDANKGEVAPGAFFYSPTRFGDLLGFKREKNGSNTRQAQEIRDAMDEAIDLLMRTSIEGDVMRGGKRWRCEARGLVVDQGVTLEPERRAEEGRKGPGRRREKVYRISDGLLQMMHDGGAYFMIPSVVLRPPDGVDQRTWDDAFKVFFVLAGHARTNASSANSARLPWKRKTSTLLTDANTVGRTQKTRVGLERLTGKLLPALKARGVLSYTVSGDDVRYDVPTVREQLGNVPRRALARKDRKALPAGAVPSTRKAERGA